MRLVFMGTPDFAVPSLEAALAAGHEIAAVYTQPPRPAGRGLSLRKSPVHVLAESENLPVLTPATLKSAEEQDRFRSIGADAALVVAYGLILPAPVLSGTRHGAFNLHASALPRWRGAAPIARAILAGDAESGASIMRLDEGLDTGPVCLLERIPIGRDETAGELHDRLADIGARLLMQALAELAAGTLQCQPQSGKATYANKIDPAETRIDWSRPAPEVHNLIRGLSPVPGAWFEVSSAGKNERIRAMRSIRAEGAGKPGTLLDEQLTVACGSGAVRLLELQRAGRRPMPAQDFLRGMRLRAGDSLA